MTTAIPFHAGLDHRTSDPTAPWSAAPQAYSEVAPGDDYPVDVSAAPRYYGNGPVIAALVSAGLACAALGLVIVDNINADAPRTVSVTPGAASGPAAPGIGADFVAPAGLPAPPAPVAAPPAPSAAAMPDPAPVMVASGPAAPNSYSPPPPPPAPAAVPADAPAPPDPAAADPGSPPPPPSGPVVVVNVPVLPPPIVKPVPPPPPIVKPLPAPVIPLPIVKLPPPPVPAPAVCLPPHHLVGGHCV